jgi:hypothetical protein
MQWQSCGQRSVHSPQIHTRLRHADGSHGEPAFANVDFDALRRLDGAGAQTRTHQWGGQDWWTGGHEQVC